jgi:hypothetical protein
MQAASYFCCWVNLAVPPLVLLCVTGFNISIQSNSTLAKTFLWPTDQAWADFFEGVLRSSAAFRQLTVAKVVAAAGAAPGQPLWILFSLQSLPYRLTTANMTNISTAALPEGVAMNESVPYGDSTGRLISESANVIIGLPTNRPLAVRNQWR